MMALRGGQMWTTPWWITWSACTPESAVGETDVALRGARIAGAPWSVTGGGSASGFGSALAADGDVNGDGYDDVIVGAPSATVLQSGEGLARLFLGGPAGPSTVSTWEARSNQWSGHLGVVAFAGDVDGDGDDEVLVASPEYDDPEGNEGAVFVHYGGPGGPAATADLVLEPDLTAAWLGSAVDGAGDVDGDGYADVLVGAKYYTAGQTYEGAVALWSGSATGLAAAPTWLWDADQAATKLGAAVSGAGDVNGDGYADLLAGAPEWNAGEVDTGAAFVFHGSPTGPGATPAWRVTGDLVADALGTAVAGVGDVNGDGFADVVIGTPGWDGPGTDLGRAQLYLGGAGGLGATPAWTVTGTQDGERLGEAVAGVPDFDGDGFDDVLVGSPLWNTGDGRVALYLGAPDGLLREPLGRVDGDPEARFGTGLAGGDVNGDGLGDLLLGSPAWYGPMGWEGAVDGLFGRTLGDTDGDGVPDLQDVCLRVVDPPQLDLDGDGLGNACDTPFLVVDGELGPGGTVTLVGSGAAPGETVRFWGAAGGGGVGPCLPGVGSPCLALGPSASALGSAVADGDGVATRTVLVPSLPPGGTWSLQAAVGRVPVPSTVTSPVVVLDADRLDHDLDGLTDAREGELGTDPLLADTDGDGLDDATELAPHLDPLDPDTDQDGVMDRDDACFAGDDADDADGDGLPARCDGCRTVADPADVDTDGDGIGDVCEGPALALRWTGAINEYVADYGSVAGVGDVDGDGFDDVLVGASYGAGGMGAAYLYPGSPAGPLVAPSWTAEGQYDGFGWLVDGAGDVNGDGFADLLVNAPISYDLTDWVYVFHGGPAGPSATADWTGSGYWMLYGWSAAGVGDVNGDGFDDVAVGAATGGDPTDSPGVVLVYAGSATGLDPLPTWTLEGAVPSGWFGQLVEAAGDPDGDGFADLVVGSMDGAWLFSGSPGGPVLPVPLPDGAFAVGSADVNGDDVDDLLVSTQDPVLGGVVRVYSGSPWGVDLSAPQVLSSDQPDAGFGASVAGLGDLNGDGYDDVGVGAPVYDRGQRDEGIAVVYLGGPDGPAAAPAWLGESNVPVSCLYGYCWTARYAQVDAAGDTDGDGFADVVLGAPGTSNGGTAWVYGGLAR